MYYLKRDKFANLISATVAVRPFTKALAVIHRSQSFGNTCSNHPHISLLLYCTTHVSHVTTVSGWQLSITQTPHSQACVVCKISIAYISAISKPIHFWFFTKNYLLFKGNKVSYNRKYPTLPVQFRNSQPQPLKLGMGLRPLFGKGNWVSI